MANRQTYVALICCRVVTVLFVASGVAAQPPDDFLLAPGRAGRIEIGLPVNDLYQLIGRSNARLVDLYREGMFDPALEIRLPGSSMRVSAIAPIREWPCLAFSVQGIEVRDPRFHTREGVGVGSRLGDVQKYYRVILSREEGPHALAPDIRMTFDLESDARMPTVRVTSVWLYGDPDAIRAARCPDRSR